MNTNGLHRAGAGAHRESVRIGAQALRGTLECPERALGIVVFANDVAASHNTLQNLRCAQVWRAFGLGTLLFDLLTEQEAPEAQDRRGVPGIAVLGARLADALDWLERRSALHGVPAGLFGVGVGAAAALLVAARQPESVAAVVCRDGRTDFAGAYLPRVRAPTLLLVSSEADAMLGPINRSAMAALTCQKRLEILPRVGRPDADDHHAPELSVSLAGHWFEHHLSRLQH